MISRFCYCPDARSCISQSSTCKGPPLLPSDTAPGENASCGNHGEGSSRQGNKRRGSSARAGEDAGLGPIPARRIPQDHRPPSPGAAVMSWHREGAAGSRALEQVALARFLPPAGAPERWGWGDDNDKMGVIPPPVARSALQPPILQNPTCAGDVPVLSPIVLNPLGPDKGWFSPVERQGFGQAGVKPDGTFPAPRRCRFTPELVPPHLRWQRWDSPVPPPPSPPVPCKAPFPPFLRAAAQAQPGSCLNPSSCLARYSFHITSNSHPNFCLHPGPRQSSLHPSPASPLHGPVCPPKKRQRPELFLLFPPPPPLRCSRREVEPSPFPAPSSAISEAKC